MSLFIGGPNHGQKIRVHGDKFLQLVDNNDGTYGKVVYYRQTLYNEKDCFVLDGLTLDKLIVQLLTMENEKE